jgi:hypothetical protein
MLDFITDEKDKGLDFWRRHSNGFFSLHISEVLRSTARSVRLQRDGFVTALGLMTFQSPILINPFLLVACLEGVNALQERELIHGLAKVPDAYLKHLLDWPEDFNEQLPENVVNCIKVMAPIVFSEELVSDYHF